MNWHSWKWRLARLLRLTRTDQDLDEEIRAHLAIEMRQRIDAGDAPEAARLNAAKDFGNVALVKEVTREMWTFTSFERLWQDAQYAVRSPTQIVRLHTPRPCRACVGHRIDHSNVYRPLLRDHPAAAISGSRSARHAVGKVAAECATECRIDPQLQSLERAVPIV